MTLFTKNRTHYQQPNKWVLQCLSNSTSQYIQSFLTNHNPYISTITTTQNHITYIIDIFTLKKQEMIFLNKIPTPLSTTNKWVLQYLTIQLKPYLKLTLQQRKNVKKKRNELYPLVQTLRSHEHDLGPITDLRLPQCHCIHQKLPYHTKTHKIKTRTQNSNHYPFLKNSIKL